MATTISISTWAGDAFQINGDAWNAETNISLTIEIWLVFEGKNAKYPGCYQKVIYGRKFSYNSLAMTSNYSPSIYAFS